MPTGHERHRGNSDLFISERRDTETVLTDAERSRNIRVVLERLHKIFLVVVVELEFATTRNQSHAIIMTHGGDVSMSALQQNPAVPIGPPRAVSNGLAAMDIKLEPLVTQTISQPLAPPKVSASQDCGAIVHSCSSESLHLFPGWSKAGRVVSATVACRGKPFFRIDLSPLSSLLQNRSLCGANNRFKTRLSYRFRTTSHCQDSIAAVISSHRNSIQRSSGMGHHSKR